MSFIRLSEPQKTRKGMPPRPVLPTKTELRTQFAALCFRECKGKTQVLLITGRRSGNWILPKGWPMNGRGPAQVAQQEAWEEAGAKGTAIDQCQGVYSYRKRVAGGVILPCVALIYPVHVDCLKKNWPEVGQRRRKWFSTKKAARKVSSPELARVLRSFDMARLRV